MKIFPEKIRYKDLKELLGKFYKRWEIEKEEEIDFLIKEITQKDEVFFILNGEKHVDKDILKKLELILLERKEKKPLPYILGYSYFWKNKFLISENTLIPRKETEFLVEEALSLVKVDGTILELCSGSGAVIISIIDELKNGDVKGVGVDISQDAVRIARKNARMLHLEDRVKFICGDLLKPIKKEFFKKVILIVVNPPYISKEEMKRVNIETRLYEPKLALYGGEDGLDFYRTILNSLRRVGYLNPISFEVGYNQFEKVLKLGENYGFKVLNFRKDYLGYRRIITFRRKNGEI